MKTQEEIDELYHKLYDISLDGEDTLHYYSFVEGYKQCQEDMADKKLDVDDINEMALDYIIRTGGLPDSVEAFQYCLHKFYEQINKQD